MSGRRAFPAGKFVAPSVAIVARSYRRRSCRAHAVWQARSAWLRHDDRGSGTVAGVMLILLAGVLIGAVASAGNLLVCQSRARSAADIVAVSAASALRRGSSDPCAVADAVASANDARLGSCAVDGEDVQVDIEVSTQVPFAPRVSRGSRAGPVACR